MAESDLEFSRGTEPEPNTDSSHQGGYPEPEYRAEAPPSSINYEDLLKQAEIRKIEAEIALLEPKSWFRSQWFWQAFFSAVIGVPLVWFFVQNIFLPTLETESIKYKWDQAKVFDEQEENRVRLEEERRRLARDKNKLIEERQIISIERDAFERAALETKAVLTQQEYAKARSAAEEQAQIIITLQREHDRELSRCAGDRQDFQNLWSACEHQLEVSEADFSRFRRGNQGRFWQRKYTFEQLADPREVYLYLTGVKPGISLLESHVGEMGGLTDREKRQLGLLAVAFKDTINEALVRMREHKPEPQDVGG